MFTLHHWPLDPASRQVRLALAEKRIEHQAETVKFWEAPEDFLAISDSGLPPVLLEDVEGGRLAISGAGPIIEYLDETRPDPKLTPGGPAERAEIRRLADWFDRKYDAEVNAWLVHEKLEKRVQALGAPDMGALRQGKAALRFHLDYMTGLLDARDGLAGPRFTRADIAAAAHLSVADYLGEVPWDDAPAVKAWYERIKSRPSFRPLLEDRLPGFPPAGWYAALDF